MGATVITGCDAPPVLEPAEHDFDFVALFVAGFAKVRRMPPTFSRRDAGLNVLGFERISKLIAVIAFVADQRFRTLRQCGINQLCADMVACLARRQAHDQWSPLTVNGSMKL